MTDEGMIYMRTKTNEQNYITPIHSTPAVYDIDITKWARACSQGHIGKATRLLSSGHVVDLDLKREIRCDNILDVYRLQLLDFIWGLTNKRLPSNSVLD
jgi:hypothetical protein